MKNNIREKYKILRSQMDAEAVSVKSREAQEFFLSSEIYKNAKCIMVYMPLGNETQTTDIIKSAFADGKKLVFPVTDKASGIITPTSVECNTSFKCGAFSVSEPECGNIVDINEIDVVLVPGIAFDKFGTRVGFGKGCYDRFLDNTSAVKIGFCYDFQLCDKINSDEHDINMDLIITESGIINILTKSY